MTTLTELAAMLDAATGPSRELDSAIAVALDGFETWPERYEGAGVQYCRRYGDDLAIPGAAPDSLVPHYTSSIDAALALVERLLPGWDWGVERYGLQASGKVWPAGWHDAKVVRAFAPTTPLAILKALVAALIAQEKSDD
jgi:hypothetical protein